MTNTLNEARESTATALSKTEVDRIDAYWRAANYLSIGRIYLRGNALLREPVALTRGAFTA
jgi:xylulose-5-phosphate/fructose-6-phosphate phosphoketolase